MTTVSCPSCGCIIQVNKLADGEDQEVRCEHCGSELYVYVDGGELRVELSEAPAEEGPVDDYDIETYLEA